MDRPGGVTEIVRGTAQEGVARTPSNRPGPDGDAQAGDGRDDAERHGEQMGQVEGKEYMAAQRGLRGGGAES
jgi:hypothetical protein